MTDFQNQFIPGRIKKTISRVDFENAKGLIHRVTVTTREGLSKTVGCEQGDYANGLAYDIFRILKRPLREYIQRKA